MDEILKIVVVVLAKDDTSNEVDLEIRNVGDVLEFYLDGKKIFVGDWAGNFEEVFKRALEIWGEKKEG